MDDFDKQGRSRYCEARYNRGGTASTTKTKSDTAIDNNAVSFHSQEAQDRSARRRRNNELNDINENNDLNDNNAINDINENF